MATPNLLSLLDDLSRKHDPLRSPGSSNLSPPNPSYSPPYLSSVHPPTAAPAARPIGPIAPFVHLNQIAHLAPTPISTLRSKPDVLSPTSPIAGSPAKFGGTASPTQIVPTPVTHFGGEGRELSARVVV